MVKKILGVKIHDITAKESLSWVEHWLKMKNATPKIVTTVGPEFIVTAQYDQEFKKILNDADLSLPEGVGLQRFAGIVNRTPGTDFMLALCNKASVWGWKVGLLGGWAGVAQNTEKVLKKSYPGIKIVFAIDGRDADNIVGAIHESSDVKLKCDLLFVALGHPKQEKFLYKLRTTNSKLLIYRVGLGVGGAFDQISGNISRPPEWISNFGFEWLYRVFVEKPSYRWKRFKRLLTATIIFPLLIFKSRLISVA